MGYWEKGYWPMWPFGQVPALLGLFGACLFLLLFNLKKKQTQTKIQPKTEEGEETTPALHTHTVSRQPGSCFIFFRVDFVLQVAGSHEPQK